MAGESLDQAQGLFQREIERHSSMELEKTNSLAQTYVLLLLFILVYLVNIFFFLNCTVG